MIAELHESASRKSVCKRAVWALALVAIALVLFAATGRQKMRDFEVYWTAGARAAAAAPLYRAADEHYRFKYLPAFALAMAPLSQLPLPVAKAAWMVVSVFCLAALVSISVRLAGTSRLGPRVLAILTVVAMAKFFAHELVLGQANLLFATLCAFALVWLLHGREVLSGASFGGATLVKPYAILFVPYLLFTRRWTAAVAAGAATLLVLFAPALVYGAGGAVSLTQAWWRTATETSVPLLTNADSVSVFAMYAKWLGWGAMAAALSAGTVAVLVALFAWVVLSRRGLQQPEVLEVGLALTLIPLVTPQGWDYVLLVSTPLVALLLARVADMRRAERAIFVLALVISALSLFDVMGRAAYATFMALAVITVCYLAIVVVAVRVRLRRLA